MSKTVDGGGLRFNEGKTRFELVSPELAAGAARALAYGAGKYEPWNWARGMPTSSVYGCLSRHLAAWYAGEDIDEESGVHHLDLAAANIMFLLHFKRYYPQGDDRPRAYFVEPEADDGAKS